ncbi:MAG: TonB-dependent receptor [candidate division KSB1 bacterium]|nr:TonB-dependent receptor [candidate division KSB1 bacterium]
MNKTISILCLLLLLSVGRAADQHLHGIVYGLHFHEAHQDTVPLVYANIYWRDTTVGTTSDTEGRFHLPLVENSRHLIVRYVGYKPDTLMILSADEPVKVYLSVLESMEEVTVEAEKPHALHLHETPVATQRITQQGLRTLACCNLAESFENTMAVDVEQTDAVSGAKRIKLLGLAGFYTQFLIEKNPTLRGLISPFSLEYIPGFWIESIDISKGTASVASGYESITGQINVELKKPEREAPIALNLYQNHLGRSEATLSVGRKVSERLSTLLLAYGSLNNRKWDDDHDTFVDMPLVSHFSVMNRWKLSADHLCHAQPRSPRRMVRQGGNAAAGRFQHRPDFVRVRSPAGFLLGQQDLRCGGIEPLRQPRLRKELWCAQALFRSLFPRKQSGRSLSGERNPHGRTGAGRVSRVHLQAA